MPIYFTGSPFFYLVTQIEVNFGSLPFHLTWCAICEEEEATNNQSGSKALHGLVVLLCLFLPSKNILTVRGNGQRWFHVCFASSLLSLHHWQDMQIWTCSQEESFHASNCQKTPWDRNVTYFYETIELHLYKLPRGKTMNWSQFKP